jgi:Xaa-Pro aminopeptidase
VAKSAKDPDGVNARLSEVRRHLRELPAHALLVTDMVHVRYLSGFTGSEAVVVITARGRCIMVDSRYAIQAKKETRGYKVVQYSRSPEEVYKYLRKRKVERLAYEADGMTHARYLEIRRAMKGIRLVRAGDAIRRLRSTKSPAEARLIKKAAEIARDAFEDVAAGVRPGVRERDLALGLETRMRELGSEGAPFPAIVASGKRGALPHGIASEKKLKKGELVTVDFGAVHRGYQSDQTITFCMGRPTKKQSLVYDTVREAHDRAMAAIRPGARCRDVDKIARDHIKRKGFGKYFGHGLGHGVGLETHEEPVLGPRSKTVLEEGMVVTVEPGIYMPGYGGVRIEDMVIVTGTGHRCLTKSGGPLREL